LIKHRRIALTELIFCEILQGIGSDAQFLETERELEKFRIFETSGKELALASAINYRFLRAKGHTVRKTIDTLIATFCLMQGHTLLHRDRDFDPFELHLGLDILHPGSHHPKAIN
jgi:predicted nucleic acid-binding protein